MVHIFTDSFTHIIDGKPATSPTAAPVIDPATGEVFAQVPVATYTQLEQTVAAADRAFASWSAKSWQERGDVLHALGALIERHAEQFTNLIMREVGKDRGSAAFEVGLAAQAISGFANHRLEDEIVTNDHGRSTKVRYRPYGVCAAVIAFNFPLIFTILKLSHALLAGNCLILKTAPTTPCVPLKFTELAQSIVPPGVLSVLYGGDDFGKAVMHEAAAGVKPLTLELGGNDPAIVLPDVDARKVAQRLFIGAINNAGQQCFAMKRLFIHEDIYDAVRDEIVTLARHAKVGNPFDPETIMGPVQNQRVYEKLKSLIVDCKAHGYKIAYEGEAGPAGSKGYFIPITVIDDPPDDARIVREEQFGPIIPLLRWKDDEEVITVAHDHGVDFTADDTEYGLDASIWGSDMERIQKIADRLYVGTVWINEWAAMTGDLPMRGVKHSGIGVESSKHGLAEWVYTQAFVCRESLDGR
ncbi:NAD-dependent succinate aldehyde dehydrogenase [Dichomitus squalens]|uniref:NAD-dependent succinate aldehyde dehydrogenase n=1 Tax=Dichomitus squalens TaxID=114155 RepID=A0A4Q9MY61_9APHY|nr:NAD-dependent succinate aldehyde dehydrogenase [Dichomitus squalens]